MKKEFAEKSVSDAEAAAIKAYEIEVAALQSKGVAVHPHTSAGVKQYYYSIFEEFLANPSQKDSVLQSYLEDIKKKPRGTELVRPFAAGYQVGLVVLEILIPK